MCLGLKILYVIHRSMTLIMCKSVNPRYQRNPGRVLNHFIHPNLTHSPFQAICLPVLFVICRIGLLDSYLPYRFFDVNVIGLLARQDIEYHNSCLSLWVLSLNCDHPVFLASRYVMICCAGPAVKVDGNKILTSALSIITYHCTLYNCNLFNGCRQKL